MGIFRKLLGGSSAPPAPRSGSQDTGHNPPPPPFDLPVEMKWTSRTVAGRATINVVGEGFRQDAFERAVGPKTVDGATVRAVTVQLVRDVGNPYDPNAVAVYLGREHVGFVPADEATAWAVLIAALNSAGLPAACHGEVTGGWHRPGDVGHYGLVFYADYPTRQLTQDDPILTIGRGSRVQIQGEEAHQTYLFGLLGGSQTADVIVTLRHDENGSIAAFHNGQPLGSMTKTMSQRYGPAIDHLVQSGWPTTCSAIVSLGKSKLEVALRLPNEDIVLALI